MRSMGNASISDQNGSSGRSPSTPPQLPPPPALLLCLLLINSTIAKPPNTTSSIALPSATGPISIVPLLRILQLLHTNLATGILFSSNSTRSLPLNNPALFQVNFSPGQAYGEVYSCPDLKRPTEVRERGESWRTSLMVLVQLGKVAVPIRALVGERKVRWGLQR